LPGSELSEENLWSQQVHWIHFAPFSMIEGNTSCIHKSKKLRANFNLTNKSHLCDCGVYSPGWHSAQGKSCNDTHAKCKVETRNQEEYTRPWIGDCLHAVGKDMIFCTAFEKPVNTQAVKKVNIFFHENNAADVQFLMKISPKSLHNCSCKSPTICFKTGTIPWNHSSMKVSDSVTWHKTIGDTIRYICNQ
jgi:hypothetical protein